MRRYTLFNLNYNVFTLEPGHLKSNAEGGLILAEGDTEFSKNMEQV